MSHVPRLSINPILPKDSLIFKLVGEGKLAEFKSLLEAGEASLRDHDETGQSLLHVSIEMLLIKTALSNISKVRC